MRHRHPGHAAVCRQLRRRGRELQLQHPVQTYWKNFGPRVGVLTPWTRRPSSAPVSRGVLAGWRRRWTRRQRRRHRTDSASTVSANGTPESTTGVNAGPSFYLNNGATFTAKGLANTDLLGHGLQYRRRRHSERSQPDSCNTGNYLNELRQLVTASSVSFADFYFSGRAPEFTFWNAGLERSITKDMTIAVNYVGDQSHFLTTGGNARGYWANQLNPDLPRALGRLTDSTGTKPILIAAATSANVAKAQSAMAASTFPPSSRPPPTPIPAAPP